MIQLPPSSQHSFAWVWSGDPALAVPPESADKEAREEYEHRLEVARDTGKWSLVLRDGETPTVFTVQPLSGTLLRRVTDEITQGRYQSAQAWALIVRLCLRSIQDPEIKVTLEASDYGERAKQDVVDVLDRVNPGIVTELGAYLYKRASSPPGK